MTSFISEILQKLQDQGETLSEITFILPSKRAGSFLRKELSAIIKQPVFSPAILSIEEFSENISALKTIDATTSLFEFYSVYLELTPKEYTEDFESFSNWAQTLLHDFNEIDRYLIPPDSIFNYLSEIQDINHWYLQPEKSDLVKKYLQFWKKLPQYYKGLKNNLLEKNQGYQGLIYRQASEKIEEYAQTHNQKHVFIGFNALNAAEQLIIQKMLEYNSQIFWDIDEVHFQDKDHDVSLFMREYKKTWNYYNKHEFEEISKNYNTKKDIELIGIPKNIGQAKYVGEILDGLSKEQLNTTALVLGDEGLLLPMLNSLPTSIEALNITMGYPLKFSPFASLFEKLFEILKLEKNQFYYKDVISVLSNPIIQKATKNKSDEVIGLIKKNNLLYLSKDQIMDFFSAEGRSMISHCFIEGKIPPLGILQNFDELILKIQGLLQEDKDEFNLEFLYHYHKVIEQLTELVKTYPHLKTTASLQNFYKELSSLQMLDFQGKPFQGLQLMGMLESRVLDFETVILTSVDEGTLPAGKSTNSFIPYELKKTYNLPTYKEKDAVYTYHFYHLLQRAKKIYLLHNSDTDSQMGGEKSRFLIQLELEKQAFHNIKNSVIVPDVPKIDNQMQSIPKTPEILEKIKVLAEKGFSPSSLTTYIRNPLDFYIQYVLGIRDKEEVEETVAHNTLGTVVHETLEAFYKPLEGKHLSIELVEEFIRKTPKEVIEKFKANYSKVPLSTGKNLLIFEVVKRYVTNFLKTELEELKSGKIIQIREIETNLKTPLVMEELDFPVNIRGNVDRVDITDGILRIIDYKTGKVLQNQLEITDWDLLTSDYDKYAKPFQVLMYGTMLLQDSNPGLTVEAGVISFKNLKAGFLKFAEKDKPGRGAIKKIAIDEVILEKFQEQLKKLILEICDPKIAFNEKEIKTVYGTY
ncbi:MAG: PD-(D/E)XK nuclease family protein [Bacteroidota bacterium]